MKCFLRSHEWKYIPDSYEGYKIRVCMKCGVVAFEPIGMYEPIMGIPSWKNMNPSNANNKYNKRMNEAIKWAHEMVEFSK